MRIGHNGTADERDRTKNRDQQWDGQRSVAAALGVVVAASGWCPYAIVWDNCAHHRVARLLRAVGAISHTHGGAINSTKSYSDAHYASASDRSAVIT